VVPFSIGCFYCRAIGIDYCQTSEVSFCEVEGEIEATRNRTYLQVAKIRSGVCVSSVLFDRSSVLIKSDDWLMRLAFRDDVRDRRPRRRTRSQSEAEDCDVRHTRNDAGATKMKNKPRGHKK
jgi:hypothetical protein